MQEKKPTNPWLIIGWIVLAMMLLPIAGCFAAIAIGQFQDYQKRSEAAQSATP